MLEEQQLIVDPSGGALVDEALLEHMRRAVVDPAKPSRVQRRRAAEAHGTVVPVRRRWPPRPHDSRGRPTPSGRRVAQWYRSAAADRVAAHSSKRVALRALTVTPRRSDPYRMSAYLVRPRSSIADPELARAATVDLPTGRSIRGPSLPRRCSMRSPRCGSPPNPSSPSS